MNNVLGTIREFRTAQFRVIVDALEDYDADLSFDETGETQRQINDGAWLVFCARVRVIHDVLGEVGSDYLGSCIYAELADFEDHRACAMETRRLRATGSNAVCGSYFADMIRAAISEARATIEAQKHVLRDLRVRA